MSAFHQNAAGPQIYTAHTGASLLSEVAYSICVLFPKALVTAGFHAKGHALMVRCNEYDPSLEEWNADFFEHEFINDPLLVGPQPVKAVFTSPEAFLLTPSELFVEEQASLWLQQIFFREHHFTTEHCAIKRTDLHISYYLPQGIRELIRRYFGEAVLAPVTTAHLCHPTGTGLQLQCTVAPADALASLHSDGRLLWCQEFPYTTAEDIAYQLKSALQQYGAGNSDVKLDCYTAGISANATADALASYFPNSSQHQNFIVTHDSQWRPTLFFLSQLRTCVL